MLAADIVIISQKVSQAWVIKTKIWIDRIGSQSNKVVIVSELPRLSEAPLHWQWIETQELGPFQKRKIGFQNCTSPLVLFFDFDTWIDSENLELLFAQARELSVPTLLRGSYLSPVGTSQAGRAYNEICDAWVRSDPLHFLGGAFALWQAPFSEAIWAENSCLGGEEEIFSERWVRNGLALWDSISFCTWHASHSSSWWFFKRAYLHGKNKNWKGSKSRQLSFGALFMEKDYGFRFWILLHFAGLAFGAGVFLLKKTARKAPLRLARA